MSVDCAAIVERDDPRLYKTALFVRQPEHARLLILYAFDCELSRAARRSSESLIPRMRLQWWRETVEAARDGAPPRAHEVAGPLAALVQGHLSETGVRHLLDLIDGHEAVLDAPMSAGRWSEWRIRRFQPRLDVAAEILGPGTVPPVGGAMADALALRHAARMAARGEHPWLPGLDSSDLAGLARGRMTEHARRHLRDIATRALDEISGARTVALDRRTVPVLLPLLWTERVLRAVAADGAVVVGQVDQIDRPFDGFRLALRALSGRW